MLMSNLLWGEKARLDRSFSATATVLGEGLLPRRPLLLQCPLPAQSTIETNAKKVESEMGHEGRGATCDFL